MTNKPTTKQHLYLSFPRGSAAFGPEAPARRELAEDVVPPATYFLHTTHYRLLNGVHRR